MRIAAEPRDIKMAALDAEARALVGRLNNLHEIFRVQMEILSYGEQIVEPLAALLLSEPSTFPEPRVAAAECLGAIGGDKAVDALIRVLDYYDLARMGPVQRFAEETVRNAAARWLARFRQPQVIDALLSSLKRDHLIGAGQALTELGETRAIPCLIECLEDDYKKEKATEALRRFGQAAVTNLCETIEHPRFVQGVEPPLSQERRARAAELLGQLKVREAVPTLDTGLHDESEPVSYNKKVWK
jgi:HEAT repeat protein